MFALRTSWEFDEVGQVHPYRFCGRLRATSDPLPFRELEETFRDRVVVTTSACAHAGLQIVLAEKRLPLSTDELKTRIGIYHDQARALFGAR